MSLPSSASSSRLPRWMRGAVLVAAVLYMQVGSFARMVLDVPVGPAFQSWRMYHSRGHDQCKLWAFEDAPDGSVTPIDWTERLGWPPGERDRRVERPRRRDATRIASRLCKKTRRGHSIRVVTQCATNRRWNPPSDTLDDVACQGRMR